MNRNKIAKVIIGSNAKIRQCVSEILRLKSGLTIFLFHEVTDNPSDFIIETDMFSSPKIFKSQVNWINQNFNVIGIDQLLSDDIPDNAAIITFDDSWRGIGEAIRTVLFPMGIPATIFLNFGSILSKVDLSALRKFLERLGQSEPSTEVLNTLLEKFGSDPDFRSYQGELLSLQEIEQLSLLPGVTFGNHLYHHFRASELSLADFEIQVNRNQFYLSKYKSFRSIFAFPYGDSRIDFTLGQANYLFSNGYDLILKTESSRVKNFTRHRVSPRIHFSSKDCDLRDFWWATYRNQILMRKYRW